MAESNEINNTIYDAVSNALENKINNCNTLLPSTTGKSTYDLAVDYGYVGTEREWINHALNDTKLLNNLRKDATDLAAYIDTIPSVVNDAINNTAVEGGILADTFVTATAKFGGLARTQADKNTDFIDIRDFTRPNDLDHTAGLQAAADVALAQKKKLQGAGTYKIKSGDVSFRFIELDLEACTFTVDDPYKIIIGGNAGSGLNPTQKIGNVQRQTTVFTSVPTNKPTLRIMGAKNQSIKIGFVQELQFYQSTDPTTYPRDASQAYSTIDIDFAMVITIDTDPRFDGGSKVDGSGTANQWFNENIINLGRSYGFYMRGSYQHNHNLIMGGSFENESVIRLEVGNKNHFRHMRFEGLDITVYFGEETLGNTVDKSCFGSTANFWIPPITTDLGQLNSVRTIYDSTAHKRSVMSLSELDTCYDNQILAGFGRAASNKFIKSKTAAYKVVGVSNMFELKQKDYLMARVDGEANAYYLMRVYLYGADKKLLTDVSVLDIETNLTPHATLNRFESGISSTARLASRDSRIKYAHVEILTLDDFARQTARNIEVFVNSLLPLTQIRTKHVTQSNKTTVVKEKPTQFVGQLGDSIQNFDGTRYTCRHMIYTSLTATSSSAAINVAEFYDVLSTTTLVNDLIGIELDNNSVHWTTVATISGGNITLTTALPSTASANNNVYISRLI